MTDLNVLDPDIVSGGQLVRSESQQLTWKILNTKHDSYDAERIEKLSLLLNGDAAYNPGLFMQRFQTESSAAYTDRLSFATYENNFGEIINDYKSNLFSKPLSVYPATDADDPETPGEEPDPNADFMQWQRHFTLDNRSMADFFSELQPQSNALSIAYFGVDIKEDGKTPYAYHIDPCSVLDWEKDDEDKYRLLIIRNDICIRKSVRDIRNLQTTVFNVWTKEPGQNAICDVYSITYDKKNKPKDDEAVPHIQTIETSFIDIPIIDCITPDNVSLGVLIGNLAGSIFARYSTNLFCQNRGINPLLVYKQGAELPSNGDLSIVNENEARGAQTIRNATTAGKAVIGPNDELAWISPESPIFEIVQIQLDKDKNEMYRLAASLNSIIGSNGVSTAQTKASGVAKLIDNAAKEHMLTSYANLVKEWVARAFKLVFDAKNNDVVWQCKGMDNYVVVDQDTLLLKVAALPDYKLNMPSKTSYEQVCMDVAYEMHPFAKIGTLNKIMEEIKNNIDKQDLDSIHQDVNPAGSMEADTAEKMPKEKTPISK